MLAAATSCSLTVPHAQQEAIPSVGFTQVMRDGRGIPGKYGGDPAPCYCNERASDPTRVGSGDPTRIASPPGLTHIYNRFTAAKHYAKPLARFGSPLRVVNICVVTVTLTLNVTDVDH